MFRNRWIRSSEGSSEAKKTIKTDTNSVQEDRRRLCPEDTNRAAERHTPGCWIGCGNASRPQDPRSTRSRPTAGAQKQKISGRRSLARARQAVGAVYDRAP